MPRGKKNQTDAPTDPKPLSLAPYEGEAVLAAAVSISNTGDGLSEAMAIEPPDLAVRDKVMVVLECEVTEHRHVAIPKIASGLKFVLRLKAGRATIIESDVVRKALDDQQRRIEEANGIQRLEFDEAPEAEVLVSHHKAGMHADGLVEGCPICDEEQAAKDEEERNG